MFTESDYLLPAVDDEMYDTFFSLEDKFYKHYDTGWRCKFRIEFYANKDLNFNSKKWITFTKEKKFGFAELYDWFKGTVGYGNFAYVCYVTIDGSWLDTLLETEDTVVIMCKSYIDETGDLVINLNAK